MNRTVKTFEMVGIKISRAAIFKPVNIKFPHERKEFYLTFDTDRLDYQQNFAGYGIERGTRSQLYTITTLEKPLLTIEHCTKAAYTNLLAAINVCEMRGINPNLLLADVVANVEGAINEIDPEIQARFNMTRTHKLTFEAISIDIEVAESIIEKAYE